MDFHDFVLVNRPENRAKSIHSHYNIYLPTLNDIVEVDYIGI